MQVDERELIERCRSGDDTAFAELVDLYKDLVYGLIYRMVRDRGLADDLAQDVFLKVHRGLPYFRGEARLSTWIFRIVQNVCVQTRTGRRQDIPLEDGRTPTGRRGSSVPRTGRSAQSRTAIVSTKRSRSCRPTTGCWWWPTTCAACRTSRWPRRSTCRSER